MAPRPPSTAATRPSNRKLLIVEAAGEIFGERGYHAASMEDIAAAVGISAAALYRHFPNKYALFATCVDVMAGLLVGALDEAPADASLEDVLAALVRVATAHRALGMYRWEVRHLEPDDGRLLRSRIARLVGRVSERVRAEYPLPDEGLRAVAALGAIESVTRHHTSIPRRRTEELLLAAALRVAATDPTASVGDVRAIDLPAQPVPRTRRAEILAVAIPLFAREGFADVSNTQIARAAGLTTSALYRHYPRKVDILAAACLQAAGLLAQAAERNVRHADAPRAAVVALAAAYVAYSFTHNALSSVAEAEVPHLPADLRGPLVLAQREHIAIWEQQLRAARPDVDQRRARLLVHAGFGVVVEAGRALRWQDTPAHRNAVTALVVAALGL